MREGHGESRVRARLGAKEARARARERAGVRGAPSAVHWRESVPPSPPPRSKPPPPPTPSPSSTRRSHLALRTPTPLFPRGLALPTRKRRGTDGAVRTSGGPRLPQGRASTRVGGARAGRREATGARGGAHPARRRECLHRRGAGADDNACRRTPADSTGTARSRRAGHTARRLGSSAQDAPAPAGEPPTARDPPLPARGGGGGSDGGGGGASRRTHPSGPTTCGSESRGTGGVGAPRRRGGAPRGSGRSADACATPASGVGDAKGDGELRGAGRASDGKEGGAFYQG